MIWNVNMDKIANFFLFLIDVKILPLYDESLHAPLLYNHTSYKAKKPELPIA